MATFGLQPNGMIRLSTGELWNPNDGLPPDPAGFNQTPMGHPLQPQTPPRMQMPMPVGTVASQPVTIGGSDPAASRTKPLAVAPLSSAMPQPAPAPQVPQGMFANQQAGKPGLQSAPLDIGGGNPSAMSVSAIDAGAPHVPGPRFFSKDGAWPKVANALGTMSAYLLASQGNPLGLALVQQQTRDRELRAQRLYDYQKWLLERSQPKVESVGGNLVSYAQDGSTTPRVIYQGQTDAEKYAKSLGLLPGSPDYNRAMQDFALRDSGPTALGARQANWDADNARADAQLAEERRYHDVMSANDRARLGLEGQRVGIEARNAGSVTPSKVIGPILAKVASGQALTPAEQKTFGMYRQMNPLDQMVAGYMSGGMGGGGGFQFPTSPTRAPVAAPGPAAPASGGERYRIGQTATGPGGRKVRYNGSTWVPVS